MRSHGLNRKTRKMFNNDKVEEATRRAASVPNSQCQRRRERNNSNDLEQRLGLNRPVNLGGKKIR